MFEIDPAWSEQADPRQAGLHRRLTSRSFSRQIANGDLSPGNHNGATYTGSIALDNTAANQDNCKSVSVDLLLHAN